MIGPDRGPAARRGLVACCQYPRADSPGRWAIRPRHPARPSPVSRPVGPGDDHSYDVTRDIGWNRAGQQRGPSGPAVAPVGRGGMNRCPTTTTSAHSTGGSARACWPRCRSVVSCTPGRPCPPCSRSTSPRTRAPPCCRGPRRVRTSSVRSAESWSPSRPTSSTPPPDPAGASSSPAAPRWCGIPPDTNGCPGPGRAHGSSRSAGSSYASSPRRSPAGNSPVHSRAARRGAAPVAVHRGRRGPWSPLRTQAAGPVSPNEPVGSARTRGRLSGG